MTAPLNRRQLTAGLATVSMLAASAPGVARARPSSVTGAHDFAFQSGLWRVRHRKLRQRLVGSTDWYTFAGTCHAAELMDGHGNFDEHRLDDPAGAYQAATVRMLQPNGSWMIWWFDARFAGTGPAVSGRFAGNVGRFEGRDVLAGRAIGVRFVWTIEQADRLRWEQSFSADDGATWEPNWTMAFDRIAA